MVRARGHLVCGVASGVTGFATRDAAGHYSGFDIDICRSVAAAIFGDPDQVRFVEVTTIGSFLESSEIDFVIRRLTWTLSREANQSVMFGPIIFHDGEGFLVPAGAPIATARDLDGKRVCVDAGEDWAGALNRYTRSSGLNIEAVVVQDRKAGEAQFFSGRCQAYAADLSMLGAIRADAENPKAYRYLPDLITKEPLAPLLRQGEDAFFQVVRWSIFALIDAEELAITSKTVGALRSSDDPDIAGLIGREAKSGPALGLSKDWAFDIIATLGNYREIFERNLGPKTAIEMPRGRNDIWTHGGLMYAPPAR